MNTEKKAADGVSCLWIQYLEAQVAFCLFCVHLCSPVFPVYVPASLPDDQMTQGAKFRQALKEEKPLQVVGAINAYHAILAKASGFKAVYISGGGVAAGSLGGPDLGLSNLDDGLTAVRPLPDPRDLPRPAES